MEFEDKILQWVSIDNQIKLMNNKLKALRDTKSILTEQMNNSMRIQLEKASINSRTPSIKISDGQLTFVKVKEIQPLTFKYLETCLSEIIKNEDQVKKIVEYVKNKREVKYVPEIKRLYSN
jgi:hypothetical protein